MSRRARHGTALDARARRAAVALGLGLVLVPLPGAAPGLGWIERIDRERSLADHDPNHRPEPDAEGARLGAARIDGRGALLTLGGASVHVGLASLGRASAMRAVASPPPEICGAEVRIARAPGVVEWWRSLPSGLEQGVTLDRRPTGTGPLLLQMSTGHGVTAELAGADAVILRSREGLPLARYGHLLVRDADGVRVPARLAVAPRRRSLGAGAGGLRIEVDDEHARYPLVVDPLVYVVYHSTLSATDGVMDDRFGASVALSADGLRALVGAPDDLAPGGAGGSARVLLRSGSAWTEEATLLASLGGAGDAFGHAVALSADGSRALVGAPTDDTPAGTDAGSVRAFVRTGTSWAEEATLLSPDALPGDGFGRSVALSPDGARALVGAPVDDTAAGLDAGSAYAFVRAGGWTWEATLRPAAASAGDAFGFAIALSSDASRALIGARDDDVGARANAGSAVSYVRSGSVWTEEATLVGAGALANDAFGCAVALSADASRAVVGAHLDDTPWGTNSGTIRIFERAGTVWTEDAAVLHGFGAGDFLGWSVAMSADGATVFAGLPNADGVTFDMGSVHVFGRVAGVWTDQETLSAPSPAFFETFGTAIALSTDARWAVIGNDGSGAGYAVAYSVAPGLALGAACPDADRACLSGFCVDGVCCGTSCSSDTSGGDILTDCEACAARLTGVADGTCSTLSSAAAPTVECRASFGGCDDAEHCEAGRAPCPPASPPRPGGVCRPAASACDAAEVCDGIDYACPTDVALSSGTPCRAAAAGCDTAEVCDGVSPACPADTFVPAGVLCRSAAGACDVDDRCSGASATCPLDATLPAGTVCRVSVGPCDAIDSCDGASPLCPSDAFHPATTVCNAIVAGPCDSPDHCSGSTADCPAELLAGVECRAASGACDVAEICLGDSAGCPADATQAAGMSCRAATDPRCDTAEVCDGVAAACPADVTTCAALDAGPGDAGALDAGALLDAPALAPDAGAPVAVASCVCAVGASRPLEPRALLAAAACLLTIARRRQRASLAAIGRQRASLAAIGEPSSADGPDRGRAC